MENKVLKAHANLLFLKEIVLKKKIKAEGKKTDENKKNPNNIKNHELSLQKKTAMRTSKTPLIENPIN